MAFHNRALDTICARKCCVLKGARIHANNGKLNRIFTIYDSLMKWSPDVRLVNLYSRYIIITEHVGSEVMGGSSVWVSG